MLVARHWAEHRIQHREGRGPQVTIRRWGWSDTSPAAAADHARIRAEAALAEHHAGRRSDRRERPPGYDGADGLPIREEILAEHPECGAVITRNAYGARCLNVEDVLFADVDDPPGPDPRFRMYHAGVLVFAVMTLPLLGVAGIMTAASGGWIIGTVLILIAAWHGVTMARSLRQHAARRRAQDPAVMRELLEGWVALHPAWRLRLYRSPAGWRVLATHGPEQPGSAIVTAFFAHLGGDPVYARMCRKQVCFRARLTGKPWRMGVKVWPPRGRWPHRTPEAQDRRARFAAACDAAAPGFAACRFVAEIGTAPEHHRCAAVRDLHDRESRALTDLPMA
jgi:hypothetical protein